MRELKLTAQDMIQVVYGHGKNLMTRGIHGYYKFGKTGIELSSGYGMTGPPSMLYGVTVVRLRNDGSVCHTKLSECFTDKDSAIEYIEYLKGLS